MFFECVSVYFLRKRNFAYFMRSKSIRSKKHIRRFWNEAVVWGKGRDVPGEFNVQWMLCLVTHEMNAFISFITEKFQQRSSVVTLNCIFVMNDNKVPLWQFSKRKTFGIAIVAWGNLNDKNFGYVCLWSRFCRQKSLNVFVLGVVAANLAGKNGPGRYHAYSTKFHAARSRSNFPYISYQHRLTFLLPVMIISPPTVVCALLQYDFQSLKT